jgi:hypothetical protein
MKIIWVTDVTTGKLVAVNTQYITAVFEPSEGAPEEAVAIVGMINGVVAVSETVDHVVELIRSV